MGPIRRNVGRIQPGRVPSKQAGVPKEVIARIQAARHPNPRPPLTSKRAQGQKSLNLNDLPNLSKGETAKVLQDKPENTLLLRKSASKPGSVVVAIKREGKVFQHAKEVKNGDVKGAVSALLSKTYGLKLQENAYAKFSPTSFTGRIMRASEEVFHNAPASEAPQSITYAEVEIVERIETPKATHEPSHYSEVTSLPAAALKQHDALPQVSREDADILLQRRKEEGAYLVRQAENGGFGIACLKGGKVKSFRFDRSQEDRSKFMLEGKEYSIDEIVKRTCERYELSTQLNLGEDYRALPSFTPKEAAGFLSKQRGNCYLFRQTPGGDLGLSTYYDADVNHFSFSPAKGSGKFLISLREGEEARACTIKEAALLVEQELNVKKRLF